MLCFGMDCCLLSGLSPLKRISSVVKSGETHLRLISNSNVVHCGHQEVALGKPQLDYTITGRSSLRFGLSYLRVVFVAYGKLAWSFLFTVEIRLSLLCLRWKISWVRKLDMVFFFACGSPTVSKKDAPWVRRPQL